MHFNYLANLVPCEEGQKTPPSWLTTSRIVCISLHRGLMVLALAACPVRGACLGDVHKCEGLIMCHRVDDMLNCSSSACELD